MTRNTDETRCLDVVWKIGPLLDGELPASEQEPVESHLLACSACAAVARSFSGLDKLAAQDEAPSISQEQWARAWSRILARRDEPDPAPASKPTLLGSLTLGWAWRAAAALMIFALGLWVGKSGFDGPRRPVPESAPTVAEEPHTAEPQTDGAYAEKREEAQVEVREDGDVSFIQYKNF